MVCPECGSTGGCPARPDDPDNPLPRWEDDPVRERLGFATEGRCPNCGAAELAALDASVATLDPYEHLTWDQWPPTKGEKG